MSSGGIIIATKLDVIGLTFSFFIKLVPFEKGIEEILLVMSHLHLILHVLLSGVDGILVLFRFPSTHKLFAHDTPCAAVCCLDVAPLWISSFTRSQSSLKVPIVESAPPRDRLLLLCPESGFPIVFKFPASLYLFSKS